MNRDLVKLQAEHDQDMAEAQRWLRDHGHAERCMVWEAIQGVGDLENNALAEVVSRFAQLGFTEAYLRMRNGD